MGMTAFHNKNHIVRAAIEASAFQAKEVLDAMGRDFGVKISRLSVDGGMTANNLLMQVRILNAYLFFVLCFNSLCILYCTGLL